MIQLLPTRTFVRLVAAATVVAACSRSEQAGTVDSSAAAADTTASAPLLNIQGGLGLDLLNLLAESQGVSFNNNGTGTGGFEVIRGTTGNDNITNAGSSFAVEILGSGGNDVLVGGNGNDTLTGGAGADSFDGGPGEDVVTDFNGGEGDTQANIP